ncbi:hypothetical protein ACFWPV_26225 [Streptomyces uncialis]|uniref:hypothetical protein n=1 Tax=Streptomyces uncialis TaxID=1048205 RepID=UPI00364EA259
MPTYEALHRFTADHHRLSPEQRQRFRQAVDAFVDDLRTGRGFRPGLRVKRVRTTPGVYELSWSMGAGCPGRATWEYGTPQIPGQPHIVWRRIGGHDILTGP